MDETESVRRVLVGIINGQVESDDKAQERIRLEAIYDQVWDTSEVSRDFTILGFMAPFVVVETKDGKKGSLEFQHHPRFYFNFIPDNG